MPHSMLVSLDRPLPRTVREITILRRDQNIIARGEFRGLIMASFKIRNGFYTVSRHAGEFWQYLGLKFTDKEIKPDSIIVNCIETDEPTRVSGDCVKAEVVIGLSKIGAKLKIPFFVSELVFRGADSPQPGIYSDLTQAIVYRKCTYPDQYDAYEKIGVP